jgi:hypothetical protein
MRRFAHWYSLLGVFLSVGFIALAAAAMLISNERTMVELGSGLLFGPLIAIAVGYSIVIPQVANSQLRKDGEYLSLIFTRPVSRSAYVMTKWLTGVLVILLTNLLLVGMTFCLICISHQVTHASLQMQVINGYTICDVVCNALGYAALMMLISSVPHPWGRILLIALIYWALSTTLLTGALSYLADSLALTDISRPLAVVGEFILSLFAVSFDSYHIVNSATFPLSNLAIFISNIVLYLTLSVFIMSIREFFYAND